jgi:hypothetical protein
VIFRVKYFYHVEFGLIILEKMEIRILFFGKSHGKLTHGKHLAPKIFLAQGPCSNPRCFFIDTCGFIL